MLVAISFVLVGLGFAAWRLGMAVVLVMLVFEGALRKWVFPQHQDFFYWTKDLVLAGVYVRYFGSRMLAGEPLLRSSPLTLGLLPLAIWCLAETVNPRLPNLAVGLFGLKAYFYYVPLVWVVGDAVNTQVSLLRFLGAYALLSLPISILGIVQFFSPEDSPLVSYLSWDEAAGNVFTMGGFPRVSGTFSFISGFSTYLFVMVVLLVALLNIRQRAIAVARIPLVGALVATVVALLMTGSRAPTLLAAMAIVVMLALIGRVTAALRTLVGSVVIAFVLSLYFGDVLEAFWFRTTTSGDTEERLLVLVQAPVRFLFLSLWGYGVGSTHQAARFLAGADYSWLPTDDFEEEPGRVMIEIGPIGFLLFYGTKVFLLFVTSRLALSLRSSDLRTLAAASAAVQLGHLVMPTIFNVTAALYFWALVGFVVLLPRLDEQAGGAESG